MLSLDRCRSLLGPDCTLSDAQIERVRDQFRVMAEIAMNVMTATDTTTLFHQAARHFPDSEEVVERAAILEFDARMPRGRAEKAAIRQAMKRNRK